MLDGQYVSKEIRKAFKEWPLFKPVVQVSFGIDIPVDCKYHTCQVLAPGEKIGSTRLKTGYGISNYKHDPLITPEGKCVMKLLFDSPIDYWEGMRKDKYLQECIKEPVKASFPQVRT